MMFFSWYPLWQLHWPWLLQSLCLSLLFGICSYLHIQELLASVRALTRRPSEIKAEDKLCYADLCLNKSNRELTCSLKTIFLTAKESELLYVLMKSPETLFQREQLILKIWGTSSEVERGNVDNYISFLRERLRELKSICEIKTVYGAGYSLTQKRK